MNDTHRVFITGLSAVSAAGATLDEHWNSILSGQSGIDEIRQWDLSTWTHRLGGEIKSYKPSAMLPDKKLIKVISRQDVLGICAAVDAVKHSQWLSYRETLASAEAFNDETAIFVGSPGNKYYQQYDFLPLIAKTNGNMQAFAEQLSSEVHPTWLLRILPNNALAYTGIHYGFKGMNHNIANHAVGGMQAVIEAYHAIQQGYAARAVVLAYDVGIEPQALFYYEKLGLLSARHLKPFDKDHDGTILAEGAAALILESEASASARNATCYGEVLGGLSETEASGLFAIQSDGVCLASMIKRTLKAAKLDPNSVGLVVAHGNGNPISDISEAHALHQAFGSYEVPVTAFKWAMGHTICASGLLDTVLATKALHEHCIPGIANLQTVTASCNPLNANCKTRSLARDKPYALIMNRGFASMNAALVIKSCA